MKFGETKAKWMERDEGWKENWQEGQWLAGRARVDPGMGLACKN